ncbi:MAG: acylphosphatase [Planctomycetota bacterium]|jgi:acylphosphatase
MKQVAKHIIFSGRVQGVGFRFTALRVAERFGLTGIVRNLPNGSVEMIVQGWPNDVAACIEDIKESFGVKVKKTQIEDIDINPKYEDFKITF